MSHAGCCDLVGLEELAARLLVPRDRVAAWKKVGLLEGETIGQAPVWCWETVRKIYPISCFDPDHDPEEVWPHLFEPLPAVAYWGMAGTDNDRRTLQRRAAAMDLGVLWVPSSRPGGWNLMTSSPMEDSDRRTRAPKSVVSAWLAGYVERRRMATTRVPDPSIVGRWS